MINLSKPYPFGLDRRNWWLFAAGFVAVLTVLVGFDHRLSVLATGQNQETVAFFNQVTRWGESDWILWPTFALMVLSVVAAFAIPRRLVKLALIETIQMYGLIFVGVGLPSLLANLLKRLIGRARPELFNSMGTLSFHPIANSYINEGFPSGHTTTAFAAAMVLGFLVPRWFGAGLIFAAAVGLSRVVVGAHYPTDVVAGMVLGTLGAYAVRNALAARRWGFERRTDGGIVQRDPVALIRLISRFQRKRAK
jgi:membrane-associated phospholipid phosphatase